MALADSARAAPAASVAAVRQTAKPPADSPMQRHANDSSFDLDAGIISSLRVVPPHCPTANSPGTAALCPKRAAAPFAGTAPNRVTGFRAAIGEAHYRRPRTRREYIVVAVSRRCPVCSPPLRPLRCHHTATSNPAPCSSASTRASATPSRSSARASRGRGRPTPVCRQSRARSPERPGAARASSLSAQAPFAHQRAIPAPSAAANRTAAHHLAVSLMARRRAAAMACHRATPAHPMNDHRHGVSPCVPSGRAI
jgi:hypothetical protein